MSRKFIPPWSALKRRAQYSQANTDESEMDFNPNGRFTLLGEDATDLLADPSHPNLAPRSSKGDIEMDKVSLRGNDAVLTDVTNLSIFQVCRSGDLTSLRSLLQSPLVRKKINSFDDDDLTPLHLCAKYNHYECAKLLVEHGASVRTTGSDNTSPLHYCAIYRKFTKKKDTTDGPSTVATGGSLVTAFNHMAQTLLMEEHKQRQIIFLFCKEAPVTANVNSKDIYGSTALHMACYKGNLAAVRDLLECGADINCRDNQDMTPLHQSSSYGHRDICRLLINKGCDLLVIDKEQSTALHLAAAEGNTEIVNMLVEAVRDQDKSLEQLHELLSAKDISSETALHVAVSKERLPTVQALIDIGAKVHDPICTTMAYPVHLAAQTGELKLLELIVNVAKKQTLLAEKYIINVTNKKLETPLHRAAYYNHKNVVKYLIEHSAYIDAIDENGFTPLLTAASEGHPDSIEILIDNEADVKIVDYDSKNVLHWAVDNEECAAVQMLLKYDSVKELINDKDNFGNTPLHVTARNGDVPLIELLHGCNCALALKNEDEQTPLHLAATYGRTRAVKWFCTTESSTVADEDENSNQPLHLAATEGHVKAVSALIEHNGDVEARNLQQWTPLDCAASKGWTKTARILLEKDAPVDAMDRSGVTPLYLACEYGHPAMVKLLLDWDASLEVRVKSGKNPLDIAIESGSTGCVDVIVERTDWWQYALRNRTKHNEKAIIALNTPLRKLIRRMPDQALKVFTNCVKTNGLPYDSEKFEVTFVYEFLDDVYSMESWLPSNTKDSSTQGSIEGSIATSEDVYLSEDDNFKLNKDAVPYSYNSDTLIQNHPLSIMVKSETEHLLKHPLVKMLLQHKWKSFGRFVYYMNLFQYSIFVLFLTMYIVATKPEKFWKKGEYANLTYEEYVQTGKANVNIYTYRVFHEFGQFVIIFMAGLNLLREIFQMFNKKLHYFNVSNLLEWVLFVLALILVVPSAFYLFKYDAPKDWQWQCGAISIFLTWLNLILFIRKFPLFGIYVVMFTDIFVTFFKFFIVFLLFIIAFALGFYCLFQEQAAFSTVPYSLVKTAVMMIGEFEYVDLFFTPNESPTVENFWQGISMSFFVLFVIIMSIIIMNLLVGLAVDDIKEVQESATLERMAMQIELALEVEQTLPEFFRKRFFIRQETIKPNNPNRGLLRRIFGRKQEDGVFIMKSLNIEREPIDEVSLKQDNLIRMIKDLTKTIHEMKEDQERLHEAIKLIASKDGIDIEDQEDDYLGEVDDDEN